MNRWTVLLATIALAMFVAMGCSGSGTSPVMPNADPGITTGSDLSGQTSGSHTYIAGYYDIYLDIPTKTMEVVADRTANFTLNVIPFLNQMTSPSMGITFGSLTVDDTDPALLGVDVEFEWHHPFPTLEQYKAYDFMGVIISNGDTTLNYESPAGNPMTVGQYGTDTYMLNADGYSRWFNPTEFTTTLIFGWAPGGIQNLAGNALLNPYKAYGMGLGPEDDLWTWLTTNPNEGLWDTGMGRLMQLEFPNDPPGDALTFAYAAVLCWEEQYDGPYTPYHRAEPIGCNVTVTPNIYYDGTTTGGNLILDADLWSWGAQPSTVKVESTVLSGVVATDPGIVGGDNYSTYHLDVPADVSLVTTGGHEFWIIAECDAYGYYPVTELGEVLDIPSADGVLAAFFRYALYVSPDAYCDTTLISIDTTSATENTMVDDATLTFDELIDGPGIGAALRMGATVIPGTDVTYGGDSLTLTADFDLTGATVGLYDVLGYSDDCGNPGVINDGFEVLACVTEYVDCSPGQGGVDTTVTVTIELTDCIDGTALAASLQLTGEADIVGSAISWDDATHFSADFDLTGATEDFWNIKAVNGCGGAGDIGVGVFEVTAGSAGPYIEDEGPLPGPVGTNIERDLSVIGDNSFGHGGVYYHYSTSPFTVFQIWHYPVDYSAAATMHVNITDPFFGNIGGLLINDDDLKSIEVSATGYFAIDNNNSSPMTWGGYDAWAPVWWGSTSGALENGYLYFYMQFQDLEREFSNTGTIWGHWGNNPAGVDGATYKLTVPYGQSNYSSITGYYPADHAGSVDGLVSDNEARWTSLDSAPVGLSSSFDIIYYYMEEPPDQYGVEVMANNKAFAFAMNLATIDDDYNTGVYPVDVAVVPTYGDAPSAVNNWVCILENNGDGTWSLAAFEQDGTLVARVGPYDGTPWHCDADMYSDKLHVWYDDGGTATYVIFGMQ